MNLQIFTTPLHLTIHGFAGTAANKDYAEAAFRLSGRMWETVKTNGIKNKGKNIWVYEQHDLVFAGVELLETVPAGTILEQKDIVLPRYAYYKHIGPYNLLKQVGANMQRELKDRGVESTLPYIEIYGHWTGDEATTETELFMSVK